MVTKPIVYAGAVAIAVAATLGFATALTKLSAKPDATPAATVAVERVTRPVVIRAEVIRAEAAATRPAQITPTQDGPAAMPLIIHGRPGSGDSLAGMQRIREEAMREHLTDVPTMQMPDGASASHLLPLQRDEVSHQMARGAPATPPTDPTSTPNMIGGSR